VDPAAIINEVVQKVFERQAKLDAARQKIEQDRPENVTPVETPDVKKIAPKAPHQTVQPPCMQPQRPPVRPQQPVYVQHPQMYMPYAQPPPQQQPYALQYVQPQRQYAQQQQQQQQQYVQPQEQQYVQPLQQYIQAPQQYVQSQQQYVQSQTVPRAFVQQQRLQRMQYGQLPAFLNQMCMPIRPGLPILQGAYVQIQPPQLH
jgi:hypothetical protein